MTTQIRGTVPLFGGLLLDATTKSLEIKLDGAVATTELPWVASYIEWNKTSLDPTGAGSADGVTTGAAAVAVVAAPGGAVSRKPNSLNVVNVDTAARTLTVQVNNNGTKRIIFKAALAVGDQFWFTDAGGVEVLDANGNKKRTFAGLLPPALPTNTIGVAGRQGFGVGVCPRLPVGMAALFGTDDPASDNYGNYQYTDGSVMVWIPAFYSKYGTGANGLAINAVDVKPLSAYLDVATATAAGYALHRAFYDGGAAQEGFFVDKYQVSNNGGIASSLKNGLPLSSAAVHNPFSGLTGAPANFYYGAIAVAKTRGANFFPASHFMRAALALLALAHAQGSTSSAWNAWYDATGVTNFPKGNNNNALGDTNDTAILYVWDGYAANNSGKTGSANLFSRTTHNGQNCGVCDLNGSMWEVSLGLVTETAGTTYYALKTAAAMKNMTAGVGGALDYWGTAAQLAANYDALGATYGAALASSTAKTYGNAAQVLSEATSGLAWQAAGLGIPLVAGVGGTNAYGNDVLYDYRPGDVCPIAGGYWGNGAPAGVWTLYLTGVRGSSSTSVGCRAALYL